jgi:hypothetical protein
MKSSKRLVWLFAILIAAVLRADAQESQAVQPPPKYRLELVKMLDADPVEFIFVIGGVGFKSVASLESFLSTLPPESILEWAPGCIRSGNEPLLSSPQDMEEFRAFCARNHLAFVLIPSG